MQAFSNLHDIGRIVARESTWAIEWRKPSTGEWDELVARLRAAAEFLGVSFVAPERPQVVLCNDLSTEQRAAIDLELIPRYSAALQEDERARDSFEFTDCGERMVDLRALATERNTPVMWSSTPFNAACGEYAGKPRIFWLRESVAERVVRLAATYHSIGLLMHVEDAYRPPAVQEGLFRRRVQLVRKENPALSREQVLIEVYAKTARAPFVAAHMAGAAVDFTLREADGQPLDLGNPYPTGGASAILTFPYVTWAQFRTRTLFAEVSNMVGLRPYPGEDWHVSKGDGLAALAENETIVRYCALRDFNRATGEVAPFDPAEARRAYSHEGLV